MEILTWVFQALLAAVFLMAGTGKVLGSKMHKDNFIKWRLPQWFRLVTGIVQLVAAALLIVGFWQSDLVLIGALIIVATGIGGVMTHMRVKDSLKETMPIGAIGLIGLILAMIVL